MELTTLVKMSQEHMKLPKERSPEVTTTIDLKKNMGTIRSGDSQLWH
jgi:hypothetical protein